MKRHELFNNEINSFKTFGKVNTGNWSVAWILSRGYSPRMSVNCGVFAGLCHLLELVLYSKVQLGLVFFPCKQDQYGPGFFTQIQSMFARSYSAQSNELLSRRKRLLSEGRVNTPIFQAERSHKNQWREFVSWYVSIVWRGTEKKGISIKF